MVLVGVVTPVEGPDPGATGSTTVEVPGPIELESRPRSVTAPAARDPAMRAASATWAGIGRATGAPVGWRRSAADRANGFERATRTSLPAPPPVAARCWSIVVDIASGAGQFAQRETCRVAESGWTQYRFASTSTAMSSAERRSVQSSTLRMAVAPGAPPPSTLLTTRTPTRSARFPSSTHTSRTLCSEVLCQTSTELLSSTQMPASPLPTTTLSTTTTSDDSSISIPERELRSMRDERTTASTTSRSVHTPGPPLSDTTDRSTSRPVLVVILTPPAECLASNPSALLPTTVEPLIVSPDARCPWIPRWPLRRAVTSCSRMASPMTDSPMRALSSTTTPVTVRSSA